MLPMSWAWISAPLALFPLLIRSVGIRPKPQNSEGKDALHKNRPGRYPYGLGRSPSRMVLDCVLPYLPASVSAAHVRGLQVWTGRRVQNLGRAGYGAFWVVLRKGPKK